MRRVQAAGTRGLVGTGHTPHLAETGRKGRELSPGARARCQPAARLLRWVCWVFCTGTGPLPSHRALRLLSRGLHRT